MMVLLYVLAVPFTAMLAIGQSVVDGPIPPITAPRCPIDYKCPDPCWDDRAMDCAASTLSKQRKVVCCFDDDCYAPSGMRRYNANLCCADIGTERSACGLKDTLNKTSSGTVAMLTI
mmetsp:Transcript_33771/g.52548  ORF Transcript_33771/g.52548 Transcript_33771/m.52548 type:complete len:117 (-) Transcript_33771:13-363(-)